MNKLISILIPTRKRISMLARCIQSFELLTAHPDQIELIFRIDSDDTETIKFINEYPFTIATKQIIADRGNGYGDLHIMHNQMTYIADGKWMFAFNDDIYVATYGWDLKIKECENEFCIMWQDCYIPSNSPAANGRAKVSNIDFRTDWVGNPIYPKKLFDIWGFVSPNPMVDFWFNSVLDEMNLENMSWIHSRMKKKIEFETITTRPDGEFAGNEIDQTFQESRDKLNYQTGMENLHVAVQKIIDYINKFGWTI
jgi:hypothetical protein